LCLLSCQILSSHGIQKSKSVWRKGDQSWYMKKCIWKECLFSEFIKNFSLHVQGLQLFMGCLSVTSQRTIPLQCTFSLADRNILIKTLPWWETDTNKQAILSLVSSSVDGLDHTSDLTTSKKSKSSCTYVSWHAREHKGPFARISRHHTSNHVH